MLAFQAGAHKIPQQLSEPKQSTSLLFGAECLKFESRAAGQSGKILENAISHYSHTISEIVREAAKARGSMEAPKSREELIHLICDVAVAVKKRFDDVGDGDVRLLSDALRDKKSDCDTGAIIFADALSNFGVKSSFAVFKEHALLAASINGEEIFVETRSDFLTAPKDDRIPLAGLSSYRTLKDAETVHGKAYFIQPAGQIGPLNHIMRGNSFAISELFRDAAADYEKALSFGPHPGAMLNLGVSYRRLRMHDKAIAVLTRAIKILPDTPWAYLVRGQCQLEMSQFDKAAKDAKMAIRLGYNHPLAHDLEQTALAEAEKQKKK